MNTFGPYSPIRQAGEFYFVSGQIGVDTKTNEAAADIEAQTKQVMQNLEATLASQKLSLSSLVSTRIYLADMNDFSKVNEIYASYFDDNQPRPARECVEVSGLPNVAGNALLIEISAVAYAGKQ